MRTLARSSGVTARATWAGVILVVGASLAACTGHSAVASNTGSGDQGYVSGDGTIRLIQADQRVPAPPIRGRTLDGLTYDVANDRGKVVVVNFWASWCPPCRAEQPKLNEVYDATRRTDVTFVGVDIRDDGAAAISFRRTHRVGYPSLVDHNDDLALTFRPRIPGTPPNTIVLDRAGRVAVKIFGATPTGVLGDVVTQLLGEATGSGR